MYSVDAFESSLQSCFEICCDLVGYFVFYLLWDSPGLIHKSNTRGKGSGRQKPMFKICEEATGTALHIMFCLRTNFNTCTSIVLESQFH